MSHTINDNLLDRAHYISEQYVGTALPEVIDNLIARNDLEKLEYLVSQAEGDLAHEDFKNHDVYIGSNDVY